MFLCLCEQGTSRSCKRYTHGDYVDPPRAPHNYLHVNGAHLYAGTRWPSQTVHIQRGHEHTRTGNSSESGLGSLWGAPLNISRCLHTISHLYCVVYGSTVEKGDTITSRNNVCNHEGGAVPPNMGVFAKHSVGSYAKSVDIKNVL